MLCPTDAELADYLGDRLPPARNDELERHLDACPRCLTRLAEAPADPRFLDALRHTPPPSEKGPPAELLDRLEKLCTLSSTGGFGGADAPADPAEPVGPPAWVAHYRILHQLGAGGMGVVYQAEDSHLRRPVALKVLWPWAARDPRARSRFLREARAVAALKHDHIVTIFQVGEAQTADGAGTQLFLAMELLEGEGLDHWMRRHRHPPLALAVRIAREAAAGLAAAHECRVVHRDVKPGNLWLEVRRRRGGPAPDTASPFLTDTRVKLLDFGLAIAADEAEGDGPLVGTPAYMAPEQVRRAASDPRTDVFGLGCVLYELCTGSRPFLDRDRRNLTYTPFVPPRDRNPEIPPDLANLIVWMLAEDPADRPKSAAEVELALTAIERTLRGTAATETLSDTVTIPPMPSTRRRRWLWAAMLGVAVGGGAWLTVSSLRPAAPTQRLADPASHPVDVESEAELVRDVIEQLKACNPQFDGSVAVQMEGGKVVHLSIPADVVGDIGPLRALSHLRSFRAIGKERTSGRLTDLSPLRGKPIERIECWHNPGIRDFSPLRGMPLTYLDADGVGVDTLDDLAGLPLEFLAIDRSRVRDLSPIRTMPHLREVRFIGCEVVDFSPLLDTRVTNVRCDVRPGPGEAVLRKHPTIRVINGQEQEAFWDAYRLKAAPLRRNNRQDK